MTSQPGVQVDFEVPADRRCPQVLADFLCRLIRKAEQRKAERGSAGTVAETQEAAAP